MTEEKEIKLGGVKNRLCEPLFNGVQGGESVWEAMGRAVEGLGSEGLQVWEAVGIVGDLARISSESWSCCVSRPGFQRSQQPWHLRW